MELTDQEKLHRLKLRQLLLNALAMGMNITTGKNTSVNAMDNLTRDLDKILGEK